LVKNKGFINHYFQQRYDFVEEVKMEKDVCNSCKKSIANDGGSIKMPCPNCGKAEIVRCQYCRKIVAKYVCPECKFEGPN